jgi:hypothetical protein
MRHLEAARFLDRPADRPARPRWTPVGAPVTTSSWITLALIGGFVWGGFLLAVVTAVRKESDK